jgi:O-antigen ligase
VPLTPSELVAFTAAFLISLGLTLRRPSYGLSALIVCLPILLPAQIFATTITLPKVVLIAVFIGIVPRLPTVRSRGSRWILLAFVAMIGAVALTLIPSSHRAVTAGEIFKWIGYGLLFATVYTGYRLDPDDGLVRRAWLLSIAVVLVSALAQEFVGSPSIVVLRGAPVPRIAGLLEGPNQLAGYLEVAIALLLAWNCSTPERSARWLLGLATCTLILTFSRAGIVCGTLAAVVVAALQWPRRRELFPALAGGVCGAAGMFGWWVAAPMLWHEPPISGDYAGGVGYRPELWRAALSFFRAHPLLGIGANNYELELGRAGLYGVRTHANSWYLQALAEGGIVLFAATTAWIASVFVTLARDLRGSPWTLAAFAASVALVAHQFVDYLVFYPKVAEPWIALIALGAAARPRA